MRLAFTIIFCLMLPQGLLTGCDTGREAADQAPPPRQPPPPTPRPPPSRFSELAQCAPVAGRADAGRFVPLGRGPLGGAGCWCGGDWPREWLPLPGRL